MAHPPGRFDPAEPPGDPIRLALAAHVPWATAGDPFASQLLGAGAWPDQGWKLHLSAAVHSAPQVLARALPLLLAEGVRFKAASSLAAVARLNTGALGESQVGKFVTVYPSDDAQAVRVAVALDRSTAGLRGPRVPTDRPLRPGSLVHYRYGAFTGRHEGSGHDILDPEGRLAIDTRPPFYRPPFPALVDPFERAGAYVAPPQRRGPIAGRYLVYELLSRSWRGGVYRAIDAGARPSRTCVLKEFWRDVGCDAGPDQSPAWAENEGAVLAAHGGSPLFPRFYERFDLDGNSYLALEYLDGEPLTAELSTDALDTPPVPPDRLITLARDTAGLLAGLHELGVVYRDFKPDHVLRAPDGRLRLLDFGVAFDTRAERPPVDAPGTPPWAGPEQWAGARPDYADDVFSWGAVMHCLACGTASMPPPPPDGAWPPFRRAPVAGINPSIPSALAAVIDRAVAWEACTRFSSMREAHDALAGIGRDAVVRLATTRATVASAPAADVASQPLERSPMALARETGDALCEAAAPADGGFCWPSPDLGPVPQCSPDLYDGAAGIAVFLAALARATNEARYEDVARGAARWLAGTTWGRGRAAIGLHCGQAGVGLAYLRLAASLDEPAYITAAELVARRLAGTAIETFDLLYGAAGTILFLVELAAATGDNTYLAQARGLADVIVPAKTAGPSGHGAYWHVPSLNPSVAAAPYLGLAHGAAGIGLALWQLARANGEGALQALALDVAGLLLAQALPSAGGGLRWPRALGARQAGLQAWCHGAGGIGTFFSNIAADVPDGRFVEAARLAAVTIRTESRQRSRVGLCCGVAGDGNLLLDRYAAAPNASDLTAARDCARMLDRYRDGDRPGLYRNDAHGAVSTDMMLGSAGVGAFLLRLADPAAGTDLILPGR